MIMIDIREPLERNWVTNINYAHKYVNPNINKDQTDDQVLHVLPPFTLQAALDLDVETFLYAQRLQEDIDNLLED